MIEIDLLRRGVTSYRHTTIESDESGRGFRQATEMEIPEIIGREPLATQLDRFVDLRFRAFAFVTELDVDEALGPGSHDEATRARTRDRLRAAKVAESFAAWKEDVRQRSAIRQLPGVTGPWPPPFSLAPRPGGK